MPVNKTYTPLPPVLNAPMRVEIPQWFDLTGDSREELLSHSLFRDQVIDVEHAGGRPEDDVSIELSASAQTSRGNVTESEEYDTTALGGFDNPVDVGPIATSGLVWSARNRSSTDYTQGSGNPYQAFINYTVRPLTVLDKMRRSVPLNQRENTLRERFNLDKYTRFNVLPPKDPFYEADLDEKTVLEDAAAVETVDISSTGEANSVTVFDSNVRETEVLYLTGISINGSGFTHNDDVTVTFIRDNTDEFYRMDAYGLPTQPYEAPLHIPILTDIEVSVFASNAINDVDVRVEYARVQRTLIEKALYGLENQVRADDELAEVRTTAFNRIRDLMAAGLPITTNIDQVLGEVGATQALAEV